MNFEDFFMDSFEDNAEVERELTIGGKVKKMKFKALSASKGDELRRKNRKTKFIKGQKINDTDQDSYMADLIVETTIYPDLKNADLQAAWGVMGAAELLNAMKSKMKDGEYAEWSNVVTEVNGYDKDLNQLVEEAKN